MTAPTSTSTLLEQADARFDTLLRRADLARDEPLGDAYHDRRVADVLAHLYAWHLLLENWVATERAGDEPDVPAAGYSWARLRDLNDALYREHAHRSYDEVRALLIDSHARCCALVREMDEADVWDAGARPWLGGESLAAVAHECLAGHYEWAERILDRAHP